MSIRIVAVLKIVEIDGNERDLYVVFPRLFYRPLDAVLERSLIEETCQAVFFGSLS